MKKIRLVATGALPLVALSSLPVGSQENSSSEQRYVIAAKTQEFKEKEGFERKAKDIINTLKDNDVTQFSTLLDGLQGAHELDKTLKNNGPYTLFAPNDRAFKKLPDDDKQSLWANKNKLKQVLQYQIVFGRIDGAKLRKGCKLKSLEGHSITITTKGNDIYADKAMVTTTDIPCSNGVIHVIDDVIMPPLSK